MDETLKTPPSKGSDGSIWSTEIPLHLVPLLNGTPTSNFFPSSPTFTTPDQYGVPGLLSTYKTKAKPGLTVVTPPKAPTPSPSGSRSVSGISNHSTTFNDSRGDEADRAPTITWTPPGETEMGVDGPTETPFRFPLIPGKTDEVSEAEQEELAERLPFLRPKLHQTAGVSVTEYIWNSDMVAVRSTNGVTNPDLAAWLRTRDNYPSNCKKASARWVHANGLTTGSAKALADYLKMSRLTMDNITRSELFDVSRLGQYGGSRHLQLAVHHLITPRGKDIQCRIVNIIIRKDNTIFTIGAESSDSVTTRVIGRLRSEEDALRSGPDVGRVMHALLAEAADSLLEILHTLLQRFKLIDQYADESSNMESVTQLYEITSQLALIRGDPARLIKMCGEITRANAQMILSSVPPLSRDVHILMRDLMDHLELANAMVIRCEDRCKILSDSIYSTLSWQQNELNLDQTQSGIRMNATLAVLTTSLLCLPFTMGASYFGMNFYDDESIGGPEKVGRSFGMVIGIATGSIALLVAIVVYLVKTKRIGHSRARTVPTPRKRTVSGSTDMGKLGRRPQSFLDFGRVRKISGNLQNRGSEAEVETGRTEGQDRRLNLVREVVKVFARGSKG